MKLKTLALIAASSAMTLPTFAADYDITELDTLFGTNVSNTASLSYEVNGTGIAKDSNTVVFKVDRKVIFSVTDNQTGADPVPVLAGDVATTIFTVQNDSNAPISYALPVPEAGTEYSYLSPADGTTVITITSATLANSPDLIIPLEVGNPVAGQDGDTIEITVAITVPGSAVDGTTVTSSLALTAVEPADNADISNGTGTGTGVTAGDAIVATLDTVTWDQAVIQTVTLPGLLDGTTIELTSTQAFIVEAAAITLAKSVRIVSDPINDTTNPKAIPGAIVEYTLTITNSGQVDATGVNLSDEVPAVFDLTDAYTETYTLDGVDTTPTIAGNTLTFENLTIAAQTESGGVFTDGSAVIIFTVKLP
jgi:uncharacterized repeat protein (TIGR01451 family)